MSDQTHVLAEWNGKTFAAVPDDRYNTAIIRAGSRPLTLCAEMQMDDCELHRFDDDGGALNA